MTDRPLDEVTRLLHAMGQGDAGARAALVPIVYDELRRLAGIYFARERAGHTWQPTAVVHEAWLRLLGGDEPLQFNNRGHFLGAAAQAMRRLLVDRAREVAAAKRGGELARVTFADLSVAVEDSSLEVLAIHEALEELEASEPELAEVARLRTFGGLTIEETAEAIGTSPATVKRHWLYARARLYAAMGED